VKAGDTLPWLCYNIYGDSRYYLEIARVNKLINFRKLREGDELYFPPIAKSAN
jgi:nucleoid-associated protein YgaU